MPGPLPNIKRDEEVLKLRVIKKLTFRQIGEETQQDIKSVYRRYKRAVGRLSTGKVSKTLRVGR